MGTSPSRDYTRDLINASFAYFGSDCHYGIELTVRRNFLAEGCLPGLLPTTKYISESVSVLNLLYSLSHQVIHILRSHYPLLHQSREYCFSECRILVRVNEEFWQAERTGIHYRLKDISHIFRDFACCGTHFQGEISQQETARSINKSREAHSSPEASLQRVGDERLLLWLSP